MLIDVAKLRMQPGTSKQYNFKETLEPIPWSGDMLYFSSPVQVEATATNNGNFTLVKGKAKVDITTKCGRCLVPFNLQVNIEFEEEFHPESRKAVDSSDKESIRYYASDSIDLRDVILEGIFLELPMKAICNENCQGLCPKCGVNLNEKQCSCLTEEVDPRLAVLKKLLHQNSGKEG